MTETEHAEISRRLALAIGHKKKNVQVLRDDMGEEFCRVRMEYDWGKPCCQFDYRNGAVIFPIAERFNCFPKHHGNDKYWFSAINPMGRNAVNADTAALAVALAVIKAKESK